MATRQLGKRATRPTDELSLQDSIITGAIAGLTTANTASNINYGIDTAAGLCADSTGQYLMRLATAITNKSIQSNWAAGSSAGGLDTGAVGSTAKWFHFFVIYNPTTLVSDTLFSASLASPVLPTGFTAFRRIASIYWNGANIKSYSQNGNEFLWASATSDVSGQGTTTNVVVLLTLTVPTGIIVNALLQGQFTSANVSTDLFVASPAAASIVAAQGNIVSALPTANGFAGFTANIRTDTSGRVQAMTSAAATLYMGVAGWIDTRDVVTSNVSFRQVVNNVVQFPGGVSGFTLSNDATTPATVLDFAPGLATDTTGAAILGTSTTWTKSVSAFTVGTGGGGLDTGTVANNNWYHVFVIGNAAGTVIDYLFSLSPTAPTLPTGYTLFRRIGSIYYTASAIKPFSQNGAEFLWRTTVLDYNNVALANNTPTTWTALVPTGVIVNALLGGFGTSAQAAAAIIICSLAITAPAGPNYAIVVPVANAQLPINESIRTNTSGQYLVEATGGAGTLSMGTIGWIDTLGAPSAGALAIPGPIGPTGPSGGGYPFNMRMTLTSGKSIDTTAVTGGTIYVTPHRGRSVSLWNGTDFIPVGISELSYSLAGTTVSTVYDLFVWNNAGVPTLVATPWASATARVNALTLVYGIPVNTVAIGSMGAGYGTYVGTFATDATGHTCTFNPGASNTAGVIGYWNEYNRQNLVLAVNDPTSSWTYTAAAFRQANANAAMKHTFVIGRSEDKLSARYTSLLYVVAASTSMAIALGLDSTTVRSGTRMQVSIASVGTSVTAEYAALAPAGQHYVAALEISDGANANTFFGAPYQNLILDTFF